MNIILLEAHEAGSSGSVTLSGTRARHVREILRAVPGQTIRVGIVDGPLGTGTLTSAAGATVQLQCDFERGAPPRAPVDLLLAVPRPKVLRRLWPQLAALDVDRIILTNAERVERPYFDTHVLDPATYRPLLIEGLQQARGTRLPRVSVHRRFKVLVEDELEAIGVPGLRILADPSSTMPIRSLIGEDTGRVLLAVGPEGGWNEFEMKLLESHGFLRAGLGPRTLRTDTACVTLLALVHDALRHGPGE